MEDNPYSTFWKTVRDDSDGRKTAAWCLGLVTSVVPLAVQYSGITYTGEDLLVNAELLAGHAEQTQLTEINGTIPAACDCDKGQITQITAAGGTLAATLTKMQTCFAVGDQVAMLMQEDGQVLVILCKVVSE